jgi:hypothetical protein
MDDQNNSVENNAEKENITNIYPNYVPQESMIITMNLNNDNGIYNGTKEQEQVEIKKKENSPKKKSDYEDIIRNYESILNKLEGLQKDVNYIKKHINETSKNNNDELLKILQSKLPDITSEPKIKIKDETQNNSSQEDYDIVKEFVDIYNSETIKKSISINKELEQQIKLLVAKYYNIKENDSKIINTALMIALLKMCK